MEKLSTKNKYPWYDSQWLHAYVQAKKIIKKYRPEQFEEFIDRMDVLKTREDFRINKQDKIFDLETQEKAREVIF